MTQPEVNEARLHAYVDGGLDAGERAVVEAYLAERPEEAARVEAWRAQNEALRRAFDPVLDEPHRLRVGAPVRPRWRGAAAIAATFVAGAAVGASLQAMLDGGREAAPTRAIARQAAIAHAAYRPEVRHPVEVEAGDEAHLVAWLSKRLDTPLRAPSLAADGYRLLGGRLLPPAGEAGDAPVALFMYENAQGRRLSLLLRREPGGGDTAFRFAQQGETRVFYWIDGPLGYALAGEIGKDELSSLAVSVYRQLNP